MTSPVESQSKIDLSRFWPLGCLLAVVGLLGALLSIGSASATYMAVGLNGAVVTSPDGLSWQAQNSGNGVGWMDVATDGDIWVAVGSNGNIMRSTDDGVTWSAPISWSMQQLTGVAYGNGKWVAVGLAGVWLTSTDGNFWALQPSMGATLTDVLSDGTNWVAISGNKIFVSYDNAVTWVDQTCTGCGGFRGIAFNNTHWGVIAGGNAYFATRATPSVWTLPAYQPGSMLSFNALDADGPQWVAVGRTVCSVVPNYFARAYTMPPNGVAWGGTVGGGVSSCGNSPRPEGRDIVAPCSGTLWVALDFTPNLWNHDAITGAWAYYPSPQPYDLMAVACKPPPPPPLACSAPAAPILVGATASFGASGGTLPYGWVAASSSNPSGAGTPFQASFGTAGTHWVTLSDAGTGVWAQSVQCSVTVINPPQPTCTASAEVTLSGMSVTFTAGSGVPPYQWSAPGAATQGSNQPTFTTAFPTPGTFSVTVADSGPPVQYGGCTVTVNPPIQAIVLGPLRGVPGARIQIIGWATGGLGEYTCLWTTAADARFIPARECTSYARFVQEGNFTLAFTVVDEAGTVSTVTTYVLVELPARPDSDMDGVADNADNCPGTPNLGQEYRYEPNIGVACSLDHGEGESNRAAVPERLAATDWDQDGVQDGADNCLKVPNPLQEDLDFDQSGDVCDPDIDGDGIANESAGYSDNCPRTQNPAQADENQDGTGDACSGLLGAAPGTRAALPRDASLGSAPAAPSGPLLWAIAGIAALGAAFVFLARRGVTGLVLLFSRLRQADLLENPTRALLFQHIEAQPGIHFRELVRVSGKGRGNVAHHLGVMIEGKLLEEVTVHGYKGYRLAAKDAQGAAGLLPTSRALRSDLARRLFQTLQQELSAKVSDLAQGAGTSYGGTIYHLRRLERAGLIQLVEMPGQGIKASILDAKAEANA